MLKSVPKLSKERILRLTELPGWLWDVFAAQWEEGYSNLQRFVERHGHAKVLQSHQEGAFRLGNWVAAQRRRFKKGTLAQDRIDRLEALPGWVWHARGI